MMNLEYIICESERCGEIDLDTRDKLLDVLYERKADIVRIGDPSVDEKNVQNLRKIDVINNRYKKVK